MNKPYKVLDSWSWKKSYQPPAVAMKNRAIANILEITPINNIDYEAYCQHDVCLITGDGKTLPDDVQRFKEWGIPYDIYAVNRSLVFFDEPVAHWAAVDAEESMWFAQFFKESNVGKSGKTLRHTIGICHGYDMHWQMDEHSHRLGIWAGNTGYFAVLSALYMGYRKIILAGMPLDTQPHWYDPDDADGPRWVGACYTQWMDFKTINPGSDRVRSMGGYSGFILGDADKDWLCR